LRFPGEIPERELHQPKEAVRQHKAAIGAWAVRALRNTATGKRRRRATRATRSFAKIGGGVADREFETSRRPLPRNWNCGPCGSALRDT